MKKSMIITGLVLFVATSFVSCKKPYTCSCDKTYTSGSGTSTQDYSIYTYDDTRNRAENRCNENTSTGSDFGGDYAINCRIE